MPPRPRRTPHQVVSPVARTLKSTWLSWTPRVCVFDDFLPPEDCQAVIDLAASRQQPCLIEDGPPSHVQLIQHPVRTSSGCWIPRSDQESSWARKPLQREQLLLSRIETLIAHASGIPLTHGEPPQVLRYRAGEEYTAHPDFFDPRDRLELRNGGQRTATFLVYLSTVPAARGGATVFPRAAAGPLAVQPVAGRGILWWNTGLDGAVDEASIHQSLPVKGNGDDGVQEKWVLSKWLRARPYRCSPFHPDEW